MNCFKRTGPPRARRPRRGAGHGLPRRRRASSTPSPSRRPRRPARRQSTWTWATARRARRSRRHGAWTAFAGLAHDVLASCSCCSPALKFGKLLRRSVATMLLAVGVYAIVFGWRYAVGIVAMLFIHEMGHYFAARLRGLRVGLPMFVPFMFAWVKLQDVPHDAETDAYIALAGPMLGTVGYAIGAYFLAHNYDPRLAAGGVVQRLLPEPDQPDPAAAARRRPHHRGAVAAHLAAGRAHHRPPALVPLQHDPGADRHLRRAARVHGAELQQGRPRRRSSTTPSARACDGSTG